MFYAYISILFVGAKLSHLVPRNGLQNGQLLNLQLQAQIVHRSGKSKNKSIEFDVKEAHFTNIRFNNKDHWIGQDMNFSVGQMDIMIDLVDLVKKKISIKSVELDKPYFTQNNYSVKFSFLSFRPKIKKKY